MNRQELISLCESMSGVLGSHIAHNVHPFDNEISSLALHYGLDYAGDYAKERYMTKKQRNKFNYYTNSRNPRERVGRFVSDVASLGGTYGGVKLAQKLSKNKVGGRHTALKIGAGVLGHLIGRFAGNKLGNKLNYRLYAKKKRGGRS